MRPSLAYTILLSAAVSMALASPLASAKGKKKAKKEDPAVTIYKEAVELFQQQKYESAIALFKTAQEQGAPSLAFYNIARCHESLGDNEKAVEYYRLYVDSPDAADIEEVEAHILELENEPSKVSIVTNPAGASVSEVLEDGSENPLGETPLEFEADAGTHSYLISLEGYKRKKIKIKAGLGKSRDVDVTLTVKVEEPEPDPKPPRETLGLVFELGGGMALHIKELLQPGGDISLGVGWRFAHGPATGFAVGLRTNIRPYHLDADLSGGTSKSYGGLFATILAVPAFQVKLHERIGLEMTLPVGLAFLNSTETIPSTATVELLGGTMEGGALTLFDIGFGASLRIMIVSGLFVAVEPVRLQLLVPTSKWLSGAKVLFDMDFTVRIGFEI